MNSLLIIMVTIGYVLAQGRFRPSGGGGSQTADGNAQIVRQASELNPDGSYQWSFEADNGIAAQESGQLKNANSQDPIMDAAGSFQYTAPDGTPIQLQYTANENGFVPTGAHLPVAPPIPEAILRALAWNEAHPEEDDGGQGQPPARRIG